MHGVCFCPFIYWAFVMGQMLYNLFPQHLFIERSYTPHSGGTERASLVLELEANLLYGCVESKERLCNSVLRSGMISDMAVGTE